MVFLTHLMVAQSLKIAVISDLHFLSSELVEEGEAYSRFIDQTGREVRDLHTVFDVVLNELLFHNPDVVLIPGDLTNHGEFQSHYDLLNKLQLLLDNGIQVYVIPGNHDVNIPDSRAYMSDGVVPVESVTPCEFEELYDLYGFSLAKERDSVSLSYLTELNDSIWLLAIDTNRYEEHESRSMTGGRIKDRTMDWALRILEKAQKQNVLVLGMMHHGLVEHFPYQSLFFNDYLIDDWHKKADQLADAGLQVVFTGHFHANDITEFVTNTGNKIYDIETGSLAQYPFPYRVIELKDKEMNISSFFVDTILGNKLFNEKHKASFEQNAYRLISAKLDKMDFLVRPEFKETLTEIMVKVSLMHVEGDEPVGLEMLPTIERLISIIGGDVADMDQLSFDFPPADNNLNIILQ